MTQSHYSLKWSNHQDYMLNAFDNLQVGGILVDVTLVCEDVSVKAHKVILSACSPFFERIFSENPCKHPVIVLKDFAGWEVQAIVEFMYKGQVSIFQEQLPGLMKAAESLHIRGLASQESLSMDKDSSNANQTPTPSASPHERMYIPQRFPTPAPRTPVRSPAISPNQNNFDSTIKLPHMPRLSFPEIPPPRQGSQSPVPRRKQARPRRRSGDTCSPQDLSTSLHRLEETAENLCIKKPPKEQKVKEETVKVQSPAESPELDLSIQSGARDFRMSPVSVQHSINMKQENSRSPLPYPPMPPIGLGLTSSHNTKLFFPDFSVDSSLGFFPPNIDGCRNPLFDIPTDPRSVETVYRKKLGRPKGQHSAPRGGPPRSWTNAELTEALQQVWNKKMTTSQASRMFGIPYNSLLMYVRGKYGKSLKLEKLRHECIGAPQLDLVMGSSNNNNNNPCKTDRDSTEQIQPNTRPLSRDEQPAPPPLFHPYSHSYFPEFAANLIPLNILHKSFAHLATAEEDCNKAMDEDQQEMFRPPTLSVDDRRELVQQNGQD